MIRIVKYLFVIAFALISAMIVMINVKIHHRPLVKIEAADTVQYELIKELRGLKQALNQHADIEMQNIYPEGFVFLNAIYALAWTSFLNEIEHRHYSAEGHAEIQKAWEKINSETGMSSFSKHLSLPYGAFYNGWSSYVLGSKLQLEPVTERNEEEVQLFKRQCDKIANAIQQTTYPESYSHAAWPADVVVCVASLSLYDQLIEPRYSVVISAWLTEVKRRLDSHGMIPHAVHPENGNAVESARGSSMALMLIFLRKIDPTFAHHQFVLFKNNFLDNKFGLTGVREYANGESGAGDIDSGPVVLGFGGAATIVGMQTLSLFAEDELSLTIRQAIEAFGFPVQTENCKQYLLGTLPIADAFIAWGHCNIETREAPVSFITLHIYSVCVVLLLATGGWFITRVKQRI